MTTRNGKIARLPKQVRDDLNGRLEDGAPGKQLVEWLNGLPEVQGVLQLRFGGRPISEQNLSEWKQGGYQEWLKLQESRYLVQHLAEQAEDLEADAGDLAVSDRCATLLAVELARNMEALLQQQNADPRERWRHLQELLKAVGQLRRDDHQAARLLLDQERWEREALRLDQENWERAQKEVQRRATAPLLEALRAASLAQIFGPGAPGRQPASMPTQSTVPTQPNQTESNPIKPNQTQSNPIKPNQTPPPARERSPNRDGNHSQGD